YGPSPQAGFRAGWGDATCRPERITVVWLGQPRRNGVRAARNLQPGSATATAPCVWDGHPRLRRELLRSPGRTHRTRGTPRCYPIDQAGWRPGGRRLGLVLPWTTRVARQVVDVRRAPLWIGKPPVS